MMDKDHCSNENMILPKPNTETFNAVMSLLSHNDDSNGVNRVYSLLEDASFAGTELHDHKLQPDINTFKTLLATNSKDSHGRFSFDRASESLAHMQQVSERLCDTSLHLNADVYNAALKKKDPCSAMKDFRPPWLSCGRAFEDGICDHPANENEVLDMEKWFDLMERSCIKANIETYEALIQAWTDSGTLDGLVSLVHFRPNPYCNPSPSLFAICSNSLSLLKQLRAEHWAKR